MDIDPAVEPDYLMDARDPWPPATGSGLWRGILIDPPYSEADAEHYSGGCGGLSVAQPAAEAGF
jgi:hypothetical protein